MQLLCAALALTQVRVAGPEAGLAEAQEAEVRQWLEHPLAFAARSVWQHTYQATSFAGTREHARVQALLERPVPGLGHGEAVPFRAVFAALDEASCPVWLLGGTVRDVLAGLHPRDVDTTVLCTAQEVAKVCEAEGWEHEVSGSYFRVGAKVGEEYLEGAAVDTMMVHWQTAETSVNILFWSVKHAFVVDTTGFGLEDAQAHRLRPAAPPKARIEEPTTWHVLRQWVHGAFTGFHFVRHNRYLKMRMRGWQPVNDPLEDLPSGCVRFFMANQMAVLWPLEAAETARQTFRSSERDGQTLYSYGPTARNWNEDLGDASTWPVSFAATLLYVAEQMQHLGLTQAELRQGLAGPGPLEPGQANAQRRQLARAFLAVALEDLDAYYALDDDASLACTAHVEGAVVAKRSAGAIASGVELVQRALIAPCAKPGPFLQLLATPHWDSVTPSRSDFSPGYLLEAACEHLGGALRELRPEPVVAKERVDINADGGHQVRRSGAA